MPETEEAPAATPAGLLDRVPIVALRVVQFALDLAIVALITLIPTTLALLLLPRNPDDSLGALLITIPVSSRCWSWPSSSAGGTGRGCRGGATAGRWPWAGSGCGW